MRHSWILFLFAVRCLGQALPDLGPAQVYPASSAATITTNFNDLVFQWLANGNSSASATTYSTGTFIPSTNSLIFCAVYNQKASAADTPNTPTGNNLTWTLVTNVTCGTSATNKMTLWQSTSAHPTSGALTVTFPATELSCLIQVYELQGADLTAAGFVQVVTNGVTAASSNPTISYTTPGAIATNALLWVIADNINSTSDVLPNTNWVRYAKIAHGTRVGGMTVHLQCNALNANSATATATSRAWGGILVEIKPALEKDPTSKPTLVQYICSEHSQPNPTPPWVTNVFFNLPNPTGAGNFLEAHVVSFPFQVPSMTDDKGNTWTVGNNVTANGVLGTVLYATNVAAGTLYCKLSFNTNASIMLYDVAEYCNVRAYQPVDVSSGQNSTFPSIQSAVLNTTGDGELITHFAVDVGGGGLAFETAEATGFRTYGGRHLGVNRVINFQSDYCVEAYGGNLIPSLDQSTSGTDPFLNLSVAYKRASQGTLPDTNAIRIIREIQSSFIGTTSADTVYVPHDGNLLVASINGFGRFDYAVTNMADVLGNTYSRFPITNNGPQMFYVTNVTAIQQNPANVISFHRNLTGGAPNLFWYDIANASAFPYAGGIETNGQQFALNSVITNCPTWAPVQANDLIIICNSFGIGPASGVSPGTYDSPYWWGQTDNDTFAGGDAYMHYFNPNTTVFGVTLNMTNGINNSAAGALLIEFKHK